MRDEVPGWYMVITEEEGVEVVQGVDWGEGANFRCG